VSARRAVAGHANGHVLEVGKALDRAVGGDDDAFRCEVISFVNDLDRESDVSRLQHLGRVEHDDVGVAVLQERHVGNCRLGRQQTWIDARVRPESEHVRVELRIDRTGGVVRRDGIDNLQILRLGSAKRQGADRGAKKRLADKA
jgi:hypothetical protein